MRKFIMSLMVLAMALMPVTYTNADLSGDCQAAYEVVTFVYASPSGGFSIVTITTFIGCAGWCPDPKNCVGTSPASCQCIDGMIA